MRKAYLPKRNADGDGPDFYPTPPDATRAFLRTYEEEIGEPIVHRDECVWEPACGEGHMSKVLRDHTPYVLSTDKHDRGYGKVMDFMDAQNPDYRAIEDKYIDLVMTNPPFNLAEEFIVRALCVSKERVAMLLRFQFLEGRGRLERLWNHRLATLYRPRHIFMYAKRVHMVMNRIPNRHDGGGSLTMAWFVWDKQAEPDRFIRLWIIDNREDERQETL